MQAGVFTATQAADAGIAVSTLHDRVRDGGIVRLHRGVYFAGPVVTVDAKRWMAVIAGGPDAALSGEAAVDEWGFNRTPSGAVEILVTQRQRPIAGTRVVHSSTVHAEDITWLNGRPIVTVERMLVEIAARRTMPQLGRLMRDATFRSRLDVARLRRTIARNARRLGVGKLRRALDRREGCGDGGADSRYEERFARLLEERGVTGIVRNPTWFIAGETVRPDLYIPGIELAVEIDPDWHTDAEVRREDRLKDALYRLSGRDVERIGVDDMHTCADRIAARWHAAQSQS